MFNFSSLFIFDNFIHVKIHTGLTQPPPLAPSLISLLSALPCHSQTHLQVTSHFLVILFCDPLNCTMGAILDVGVE